LDASSLGSADSTWSDSSGKSNHASKGGSPSVVTNAQNGFSVMNYTANGQRHKFSMINTVRTVFWVVSQDSSVNGSGFRYILSDSTKHPHWHNNNNGKFWGSYTAAQIKNGITRLNGTAINGETNNYPNNLSVVAVRTTSNVDADQFGYDRTITGRQWIGKLG
jgi:hypothetical protein